MIDARHGMMEIDKKIFYQLDKILGSKLIIIFTKIDKLKKTGREKKSTTK